MKDVKDTPKLTFGQKLKNLWNYFTTYEKIWYISILVLAIVFCFVFPEDSDELAVNPKLITILYLVDIVSNITCELLISKQSKWNFIGTKGTVFLPKNGKQLLFVCNKLARRFISHVLVAALKTGEIIMPLTLSALLTK